MIPAIDHSLLSPSGRMSKRARAAAIKREGERLFKGVGNLKGSTPQPSKREQLLRQAARLHELAARGMKPRAYLKEAMKCEAQAKALTD